MFFDDGYIKYCAKHEMIKNFDFGDGFSTQIAEILKTRDYLHKLGLIGVYPNGIGFGNCSFRAKNNEFIITGSATGEIENLQKNDLCLVEKFDIAKNFVCSKGSIQASSESMTHGAIYSANPKINCVLHIHSRKIFDYMKTAGNFNFTAENIPYGTPEMAFVVMDEVKKIEKNNGIMVMLGHDEGVISFGKTIATALSEIERVM